MTRRQPGQETWALRPHDVKGKHLMPFGAERLDGTHVRFRLWAPAAREVALALALHGGTRLEPMRAATEGWWELVTEARAGVFNAGSDYLLHSRSVALLQEQKAAR